MAAAATSEKIVLNFGWIGPSTWQGGWSQGGLTVGVVDLVFKNAKAQISVEIPKDIAPSTLQKLPFTCQRDLVQTHPSSLKVTIEQIHNLIIKVGIFEASRRKEGPSIIDHSGRITQSGCLHRSERTVKFEIPEELEVGKTYCLVVTSNDFSFSAHLLKEEIEDEKEVRRAEFQGRLQKMGEALIEEGMKNLDLVSRNGEGVFTPSSTTADVFTHIMGGVVRAGQQVNPDIKVPYVGPCEDPSDLDSLNVEALQARFEEAFIKDKELEARKALAGRAGDTEQLNEILAAESSNSQWLIHLAEALERKGVKPQIPQSARFQSAANQAARAQAELLKHMQEEGCKNQ